MQKILIVGGSGYCGGYTYDLLSNSGHAVTVYDNLTYETCYLKPCGFLWGDCRDTKRLLEISKNYDTVIWLAALVGDHAASIDVKKTTEINFHSVRDFLKKFDKNKKFIFASTCSIFGKCDDILNENSPVNPLSVYASSKLKAEQEVLKFGGLIFRMGTLFGLGDVFSRIRFDLVVNVLTLKAVKEGIIQINGGSQWRPILSVKDCAHYFAEACTNYTADTFIISKENTVLRELGNRVAECIPGTKIELNDIPFQDFRNYQVDNSKALKYFKHKPARTVEDDVKELASLIQQNRIRDPYDSVYHNGSYLSEHREILNAR